jgi:hypothetical protein
MNYILLLCLVVFAALECACVDPPAVRLSASALISPTTATLEFEVLNWGSMEATALEISLTSVSNARILAAGDLTPLAEISIIWGFHFTG